MIPNSDWDSQLTRLTESKLWRDVYANGMAGLRRPADFTRLAELFRAEFGSVPGLRLFSSPGRTEIGGNHTDHQHGRVLCAAVDADIIAVAAANDRNEIRIRSEGFARTDVIPLTDLSPRTPKGNHSAALIRGIADGFRRRGYPVAGFDAYTASLVPRGSGMSSSAAFEMLVAVMLAGFSGAAISPLERAMVGQYAENVHMGKPSGLMDQCGSSIGGLIAIDFAAPEQPLIESVAFDFDAAGYAVVITDTGGSHADLTADYARIHSEMKTIASALGGSVLRDIKPDDFWPRLAELRRLAGDRAVLRTIHFLQENERVRQQVACLRAGDIETFLSLVRESGISSWTQLQNIHTDASRLDQTLAVALALAAHLLDGRGASRVHGGGFAGTIQAFVPLDRLQAYIEGMAAHFGADRQWQVRIRPMGAAELTCRG